MLHVAGDAVIDGNIAARYQDVAEWVESGEPLEAGTVVIVDPAAANGVRMSAKAYDVGVAGAVSAQPGVLLGERGDTEVAGGAERARADQGRHVVRGDQGGRPARDERDAGVRDEVHTREGALRPAAPSGHDSRQGVSKSFSGGKGEILALITLQ